MTDSSGGMISPLVTIVCCLLLAGEVSSQVRAAQTAATAVTQYVEIEGNRIGDRSIGSGRPLVLLTRMRGTLDTWDPLFLDQLALTQRVITLDYPVRAGRSSPATPFTCARLASLRAISEDRRIGTLSAIV